MNTNRKTEPLTVVIADDHPAMVEGVKSILAADPSIRVVGEASDGREAVALVALHRPDVALLDLSMPNLSGAQAAGEIARKAPETKVMILSYFGREADVARALAAGATGYLLKDAMHAELIVAVRRAARGDLFVASSVKGGLLRRAQGVAPTGLSEREVACLRLASRGFTNKSIARELFVGEQTVKTYFDRAYSKLGVHDRTAAVFEAAKRGYLEEGTEGEEENT